VALIGAGIGIEVAIPLTSLPPYWAAIGWAIAGLGMGIAYSLTTLSSIQMAPAGGEGAASASIQLASTLGIAVGTGIAGAVVGIAAVPMGVAPAIALAEMLMLVVCGVAISACGRLPATATARVDTAEA
jgi:hypothetical protein